MNFVKCHYNSFPLLINLERVTTIKQFVIDGREFTKLDDQLVDEPFDHFSFCLFRIVEEPIPGGDQREREAYNEKKDGERIPEFGSPMDIMGTIRELRARSEEKELEKKEPDPNFNGNSV